MKRVINITVEYNIDEKYLEITNKETVKDIVEKDMEEYFSWDEGYDGLKVEILEIC